MFTAADTSFPPPVEALQPLSLVHVEAEAPAPVEAQGVERLAIEVVEALTGPGATPGAQGVTAPWLLRPLDHLLLGQERSLV